MQRDVTRANKVEVLAEITGTSLAPSFRVGLPFQPGSMKRGTMNQLFDVVVAVAIGATLLVGVGLMVSLTTKAIELVALR